MNFDELDSTTKECIKFCIRLLDKQGMTFPHIVEALSGAYAETLREKGVEVDREAKRMLALSTGHVPAGERAKNLTIRELRVADIGSSSAKRE